MSLEGRSLLEARERLALAIESDARWLEDVRRTTCDPAILDVMRSCVEHFLMAIDLSALSLMRLAEKNLRQARNLESC